MRPALISLIPLLSIIPTFTLAKNVANEGFKIDFVAERNSDHSISKRKYSSLRKRSEEYADFTLTNEDTFYMANISLGTPSQELSVLLDTGSADLWVMSSDNSYCSTEIDCDTYGTFDVEKSTSYKYNNSDFNIQYADDTMAIGDWGTDTLTIGDSTLKKFSFALANETNSTIAVLGVGFRGLETTALQQYTENPYTYANLPEALVEAGLINSKVYSLYLNDKDATSGSILFGAVDHDKYSGSLETVQIINTSGGSSPIKLEITLSGIKYNTSTGTTKTLTSTKFPALLDSGTTLTYFPPTLASTIAKAVGGSYSSTVGAYVMNCESSDNIAIDFNFTGAIISVPLANFFIQVTYSSGGIATSGGDEICAIGILGNSENAFILGDSFLRAAYAVYDLDNFQISLANANLDSSKSNIETINSTGTTIPGATTASAYSQTYNGVETGTDLGAMGTGLDSGSTSTSTASGVSKSGSKDLIMGDSFFYAWFSLGITFMTFIYYIC